MTTTIQACLPEPLRGPSTTITRIAAGLSGAGVYRVEADGQPLVLKISSENEPLADWRRTLHIRQRAAGAGLAPRIIHVDEARRATVSAFVVDRSFPAFYGDPRTHEAAVALLGQTLRRVHELPLPPNMEAKDARDFLTTTWAALPESFNVPAFVGDVVRGVLDQEPPASGRPAVLSHNDVNPTNLVYDGERLMLLDWEMAGVNDPFYDLAAIALFLRMNDETCAKLLAAHDGEPSATLPGRFGYDRTLVAALCGAMFLRLARERGHTGGTGAETVESTPSLSELYQRLRSGSVQLAAAEGQWLFGLALVKEVAGTR